MAEAVISMHGITKSYGKHQVLHDVELDIERGDIFGLIGRNGAGKTTLFKVILGLSDYKGTLTIGGSRNLSAGRQKIGFLIGSNFFGYMTARQNLEYYRVMKGLKDKSEIDRVLKIVGLDTAKGPYSRFSMGMKQRLGIANAMLGSPEILILDEPTNGLDPQGIADVRALIQRLNEEFGMTVIVSSHILGELQNTATSSASSTRHAGAGHHTGGPDFPTAGGAPAGGRCGQGQGGAGRCRGAGAGRGDRAAQSGGFLFQPCGRQ